MKSYDPKNVLIIYSGYSISGFAPDTFLTVQRLSPSFKSVMGCNSEVTRLKRNDGRGEIGFSIFASSSSNLFLSSILASDELIGQTVLPFLCLDKNGKNIFTGVETWIAGNPIVSYANKMQVLNWKLHCNSLVNFIGGY